MNALKDNRNPVERPHMKTLPTHLFLEARFPDWDLHITNDLFPIAVSFHHYVCIFVCDILI